MPDNVGYTAGSGTKIASREVTYSGEVAQAQSVGLVTVTGADDAKTASDVSASNPLPVAAYGELVEAIEAMRMAVSQLCKSVGYLMPNTLGQPIVEVRQAAAGNLSTGATQVGTWNIGTTTTLTNQAQVGGYSANDQIPALMHMQADNLRRNISVS